VAEALQREFFSIVEGVKDDWMGWLTPVAAPQLVG
jgi:hypothetical protein